jgi:hypothetical protein
MKSKYKTWLETQSTEFIHEVCGKHPIPDKFIDYGYSPITLEELKKLDEQHTNPEGNYE